MALIMEPTQTQPKIDPTALALSRSIRSAEGGDYNNRSGDAGTSAGAYQWNNGKLSLKEGEIPANFKSSAQRYKLDPNDFSQTNQDHVAYEEIKGDLDAGLSQSQIAAKWNSGLTHGWENHKGTTTINGKTVNYDTPAYVAKVQKYYEDEVNGKNTASPESKVKDTIIGDTSPTSAPEISLKADTGKGLVGKGVGLLGDLTGTKKLGEGLGYAINNALGGQKGLMDANNTAIDIQGKLLQQIKKMKAKGKDTSRLEKAMKDLNLNIENTGNKVGDVGTGGLSNKDVLLSAAKIASIPALMYAGTVAGGGGLSGTARGLESGVLGTNAPKALVNPVARAALEQVLGKGETVENLSRQEAMDALTNYLKDMSVKDIGGSEEKAIVRALKALNPTDVERQSLLAKLVKGGFNTAKNVALTKILGDKVGGLIHQHTQL